MYATIATCSLAGWVVWSAYVAFSCTGVDMRVAVALIAGWIASFALVVAAPAGVDDASTLKAEFLRDYPRALEALEARFGRVRGVAKCTDVRHLKGSTDSFSKTLEFECKLPSMVRVVETGKLAVTKGDVTRSVGRWAVRCCNDDYSFELKKNAADGKFSIASMLNSSEEKFKNEKRRMADQLLRYLGAPFYLDVFPMSGFISATNVSIRSVSRVRVGTREMLKAEFEMRPFQKAPKGAPSREGWFTVSPSEAWGLHEYEFVHGDVSVHGSIEYGGMQAGVPVPRRFAHTTTKQGKLLNAQTYDFEMLDFADVPDQDFTLAAFGLPEVGRPTEKRSGSAAPWLVAFSLLALAAAVVFKIASVRARRK
jgi:hypothetical protein